MAEVWLLWLALYVHRLRRVLRLRRPAHARKRGALTVDAVLDDRYAEQVHEIVVEYRTGELPKVVDGFAEWDEQLGVAVDPWAAEVAPIAAELADLEPSDVIEFDGEKISIDELCSFTLAWRRIPGGGLERVDVYAGVSA